MRMQFVVLFLTAMIGGAFAQVECAPADFLTRDTLRLDEQLETNLLIYKSKTEDTEEGRNSNIGLEYGSFSLSGSDARESAARLSSLLNIDYGASERRSILISALPEGAVTAYVECLKARSEPISVTYRSNIMYRKEFVLIVNWHPQYAAPAEAEVSVIGVGASVQALGSTSMRPQTSANFKVTRSLLETAEISISIDGKSYVVVVPAAPRVELSSRLVTGSVFTYKTTDTTTHARVQSCVRVPEGVDGVIVAGTFKWVQEKYNTKSRPRYEVPELNSDDRFQICQGFGLSTPSVANHADLRMYGTAILVEAVPIQDE